MPTQTQTQGQAGKTLAAPVGMQAAGYSANFSFASAGGIGAFSANLGGAGSNEEIASGAGNSGGNGDVAGADAGADA